MTAITRVLAGSDRGKRLPPICYAPGCGKKPCARVDNFAMCEAHRYRYNAYRSSDLPKKREPAPWKQCTVSGCSTKSRARGSALCEMHYARSYRNGTFDGPDYKRRYLPTNGYIKLVGVDCPIANECGVIYEHRKVLFEAIGAGQHSCHWCSKPVSWGYGVSKRTKGSLVVDHLNGQKDDNRLENLVPSCHSCNGNRGLFMAWVMKHKDDQFLLSLFNQVRAWR